MHAGAALERAVVTAELRARARAEEVASLLDLEERAVQEVRGMAHCELLLECLMRSRSDRMKHEKSSYQSAALRHLREQGHELSFGCCRPVAS